ncbi:N-methyl-D-aspartate receptor NMDAR2C subunit [Pelomonas sp. HMWF004]|nr:N-methyl-D-aspartate receptor NMDAR2C subunit [Pelomonas sp. HMWF004]
MSLDRIRWRAAWQALVATPSGALHAELLARYAEPHRAYHTPQHLAECLALFDEFRALAQRPAEVEIALWFHDAVYDVHRHDNEAVSADWARTALLAAGDAPDAAERVAALVLATRHSVAPTTPDEQLLVDIDLAILGAAPARFAEYEAQIRVEYGFVPPAVFQEKRGAILAGFLARPVLYGTPALRERFEAVARANLRQAIADLG